MVAKRSSNYQCHFFVCFFVGIINITLTMLVVFEFRRFTKLMLTYNWLILTYIDSYWLIKTYIDFSNNIFSIEFYYKVFTVYMGNLIYSENYLNSTTALKYADVIKKSRNLDYYFGIFSKILYTPHLCKVS